MTGINSNATAIQAIASVVGIITGVVGIAIAIAVPCWQTRVARGDHAAARRRTARVLAMELLPTVEATRADSAEMIELGYSMHYLQADAFQRRRIELLDVLERALGRLDVFDQNTIDPILGMVEAVRDYHNLQSRTDIAQLTADRRNCELEQRRSQLEAAIHHGAEAVKRLREAATSCQ